MKKLALAFFVVVLVAAALPAAAGSRTPSNVYPPIISWQAPAFYTAPHSGRTALADAAAPMPYIPVAPCRQFDSRATTKLADNIPRTVVMSGAPCGIPATAVAVALNITVINILGAGSNGVFKVDTVSPPLTAWINYPPTETQRANAGVVGLNGAASIVVQVNQGGGNVDFVVDVFGYYGQFPANAANVFRITNNSGLFTMSLQNLSTTCIGTCGLLQIVGSGNAIQGATSSGLFTGAEGVLGTGTNAMGVKGLSTNTNGMWAESTNFDALAAFGGRDGIFSQGARIGVLATTTGAGVVDGVQGTLQGAIAGSAGVHGIGNGTAATFGVWGQQGATLPIAFTLGALGGYFTSNAVGSVGALALATGRGIQGSTVNTTTGNFINSGVLGFTGTSGVHSFQDITAGGVKSFVEPHPTDPSRQIVYIAMEGPEAGTYFRGRGRFEGRSAVIVVPESFRLVTDDEGLTVQITPIGRATAVGVTSMDLNQIVVEATQDVEFSYLVQGVRHSRRQFEPIQPNSYFVPTSPDSKMDPWPPQIQKQLVELGIYHADGKVNMGTAERMGWAKVWREEAATAAAAAAARK